MRTYRAAVIGAGRIGLTLEADPKRPKPASHAGVWLAHPRVELVALSDTADDLSARAASIAPEAACYRNPSEMLAAIRPDIVSIATHQDSHVELGLAAIEAGARAILCEKPIADDPLEARRLVDAANHAGVALIVNHARRFDPMLASVSQALEEGAIGGLVQAHGIYVYGLRSTGTHMIDLMRYLMTPQAGPICWVRGMPNESDAFHPAGDPCLDAVLGFESGAHAVLQSLDMKDYDCFELTLFGRTGKLVMDDRARRAAFHPRIEAESRSGFHDLAHAPSDCLTSGVLSYLETVADHVLACIEDGVPPLSSGKDSLAALLVLKAICESADSGGRRIDIKPVAA